MARSPAGFGGTAWLLLGLIAGAALAPWLAAEDGWPIPFAPDAPDLESTLQPPSREHWLGTDSLGRDVASRLLHGGRVSLLVGALATAIALAIGVPLGAIAGRSGGLIDAAITRLAESVLCFPTLLLALALIAAAPDFLSGMDDRWRVALVLGLSGWVPVSRYVRGELLRLRGSDLARAARASGCSGARVLVRHLLPNALASVWVTAAFGVSGAIATEAALSFLGLGVGPPQATWGSLLTDARAYVDEAWWLVTFPGLALLLAIHTCNRLGESLRDRLDPRRHQG